MHTIEQIKVACVPQPLDVVRPPHQNSIGRDMYEVARRVAGRCGKVIVYAGTNGSKKSVETHESIEYRRFPLAADRRMHRIAEKIRGARPVLPLFGSSLYYLWYILRVAADIRKEGCGIIHIRSFSQFVPVIRAMNPKAAIILHMHGEWLTDLDGRIIEKRLRKADLILGCGGYLVDKIRARFSSLAARCATVHNGVDTEKFRSDGRREGRKRILFLTRISPEKGLHVLLDAMTKVLAAHPDAYLNIVGPEAMPPIEYIISTSKDQKVWALASFYPGSYIAKLKNSMPPGLINRVSFTGNVELSELRECYTSSDIFVNASLWESFGNPIVEAMACGLPVVASKTGGIPEIVEHGSTGLLFEPGDSEALANAIIRLLSDQGLRARMGAAGRERIVRFFSWDRIAEDVMAHYRRLACHDRPS